MPADGSAGWLPRRAVEAAQAAGLLLDGREGPVPPGADVERLANLAALAQRRLAADAQLVRRAREDPNVFVEACGRVESGTWVGKQAKAHHMWHDHISYADAAAEHSIAAVLAPVGHAKALPVDTPIAVPGGWRPIGDLQVGDFVIGGDGKPTQVTAVSPIWSGREIYEFDFDDGTSLRSDADHLWSAWTVNDRSAGRPPRVVSTREIVSKFTRSNGQRYWSIPLAGPIEHPERDLPVHPYVLGVWLGDGASDCTRITCHEDDAEIVERCIAIEGGRCGARSYKPGTRVFSQTIGGVADKHQNFHPDNLRGRLRRLGVLGKKHVPDVYLLASVEHRRALLAGLMDTDGTVSRRDGRVTFTNTNAALAHGVLDLARSLGFKATLSVTPAKLHGRDVGNLYRVAWCSMDDVFRLRRKRLIHDAWKVRRASQAAQLRRGRQQQNTWAARTIVAWRRVESVPVRCIAVAAPHHTYVATRQCIVTHNSTQITRWRTVWELGRNPNLRIGIMSATTGLPEKILSGIKSDIEHNPWVRAVFPHLRPGRRRGQSKWSDLAIHVDRDDSLPDPSVQLYGLSSKILGARLDLIECDDVPNMDNTATPYMRQKVWEKVQAELFSRRPKHTNSRIWLMGHVWYGDDVVAKTCSMPGARVLRHGARVQRTRSGRVITSADDEWDDTLPWQPLLPEMISRTTLEQSYREAGWSARHMLDNRIIKKFGVGISPEVLALALERGYGLLLQQSWNPLATGCPVFVGVDVSTGEGEDLTVIVVVALRPDGTRQLLWVEGDKWTGPEIRDKLITISKRYQPVEIAVESNAQQVYIRQFTKEAAVVVPVVDHNTGSGKRGLAWGVKSLAVEFEDRRWVIPRWCEKTQPRGSHIADPEFHEYHKDVSKLLAGAANYSPDTHASDHLMALWICWCRIKKFEGDYA